MIPTISQARKICLKATTNDIKWTVDHHKKRGYCLIRHDRENEKARRKEVTKRIRCRAAFRSEFFKVCKNPGSPLLEACNEVMNE